MAIVPPRVHIPTSLDEVMVDELVGVLESRIDTIIDEIIESYLERIPSYAAAPISFLEEVRIGTTVSFHVGLSILRGDQPDVASLIDPLEEVGRRRASQGIPLAETLQSWQISTRTFWEHIVDIAPEDPEKKSAVIVVGTRVILELLELAVAAVSAGYLEYQEGMVADEEADLQGLVEILAGLRAPDRHYDERATRRGIDVSALHWCLAVKVPPEELGSGVRALRRAVPGAAVGRIGESIVAYLPDDQTAVDAHPGPAGLARATDTIAGYRRAAAAAEVARHLGLPAARYEEVMPLAVALAGPPEDQEEFISTQLGAVLADPMGEDLVKSLEAFYAEGQSIAKAARALHVHRHTLEYRLTRVETLLQAELRDPSRRLLLELAIALRK